MHLLTVWPKILTIKHITLGVLPYKGTYMKQLSGTVGGLMGFFAENNMESCQEAEGSAEIIQFLDAVENFICLTIIPRFRCWNAEACFHSEDFVVFLTPWQLARDEHPIQFIYIIFLLLFT